MARKCQLHPNNRELTVRHSGRWNVWLKPLNALQMGWKGRESHVEPKFKIASSHQAVISKPLYLYCFFFCSNKKKYDHLSGFLLAHTESFKRFESLQGIFHIFKATTSLFPPLSPFPFPLSLGLLQRLLSKSLSFTKLCTIDLFDYFK